MFTCFPMRSLNPRISVPKPDPRRRHNKSSLLTPFYSETAHG